jgi:hypothetical protein
MVPSEPGIYYDVPRADYDAIEAMNHSRLSVGIRSLAHLKAQLDGQRSSEDTAAMAFGRAYHCLILEPEVFDATYARAPEGVNADGSASRSTKDGKAAWAEWEAQNTGKESVSPRDWHVLYAMRDAIANHPAAQRLLNRHSHSEVTVLWYDRATGELCKCRVDRLLDDLDTIIDLKTTEDASPSAFEFSIYKYGYHRQFAFYGDGVHTVTEQEYPGCYIIAQEKVRPYLVGVYLLDDEAVDYGRYQYSRLLAAYSEATLTNEWPGYSDRVQVIGLPRHAMLKARQEMEVASELLS